MVTGRIVGKSMVASRLGRIFIWLIAIVIAVPLIGAAGGFLWWRQSLPQLNGEVQLDRLGAEVRVIRDRHGVPHITASDRTDAARVLGYLHAQDRFFQMDITRRVLQGRISEAIGPRGLSLDKLFRTLDIAGRASESVAALSPELTASLHAYADGVNAWLRDGGQSLPLEYALLGIEPEPWKPEDSILWGKGMAWKLSANWRQDATRAALAADYGRARAERFFPPIFPEWPVTLKPDIKRGEQQGAALSDPEQRAQAQVNAHIAALLDLPSIGAGASNEWVIDGSRSTTGMPILANDPHLELDIPILWYMARITTPEMSVAGVTAPGVPIVLLGQNEHVAWGFTTTDSDAQDLFIETIAPDQPDHYQTPDGPQPIRTETVTIAVKGEAPVEYVRRETRHGPVISDALPLAETLAGEGRMISLAWNGLNRRDTSAEAFFKLNMASNWSEFQDALRLHKSPAQNIVYADRQGNIGFINAGEIPVRASGDGRYPVDGASGAYDWTGIVPFEGWPKLFNPPAGAIVNANNAVIGADYPYWFGRDQTAGYRAMRIIERLSGRPKHDLDSMADIQMDIEAAHARDLVPFLLKLEPETDIERQALDLLKTWNFAASADRPEPLILDWWLLRVNEELLKSGLDPLAPATGGLNASVVVSILREANGFCRDQDAGPDCMGAVRAAFTKTIDELSARYGSDVAQWRWGQEHVALMDNQVLDNIPGFREMFGVSFPSDGGFYSVNRGGSLGEPDALHPLVRKSGAGFRGVYDLADPSRSRFMIATGQSGHPLSPHYADLLPLYRKGESIRLHLSDEDLQAQKTGELVFRP
jgi:penicillin amidase